MVMTVAEFKQAFLDKAKETNKDIRWGVPTRVWQTQTELIGVRNALDALESAPMDQRAARIADVRTAMTSISDKRSEKYKEALELVEAGLKQTVVAQEQTAAGPPTIMRARTEDGKFAFSTTDDKGDVVVLGEGLSPTRGAFVQNLMGELTTLSISTGVKIDDLGGLVSSILKDTKMGAASDKVGDSVWQDAIAHVKDTVLPGIATDLRNLQAQGLVGGGASLKGVKFTGSDFHKGGKQVLILRFDDAGREKKIVYKPSNLQVDALLFGKGSVAEKLGGISTYNIVTARTTDVPPKDYGYMEFVDTGGGPSNAAEVMDVYKSIAGAMAMAYYVGLEDVHHENVLMKKGSVQVIDMEATTGTFNMPDDSVAAQSGGFIDQQWNKAINEGFKPTLQALIGKRQLTELPDDGEIEQAMVDEFSRIAAQWAKASLSGDLQALEQALSGQKTRLVPIPTEALQGIIPFAQAKQYKVGDEMLPAGLANWIRMVDDRTRKEDEASGSTMMYNLKGTTSTPMPTVRNLVTAPGAYNALVRGDVPYYVRDLGSSDVFDEEGNKIVVTGMKKVGTNIAQEMANRRATSPAAALKVFKAQGITAVRKMNSELESLLA